MATERAVAIGTLGSVVQLRSMFTCDVIPSGGDTAQVLWAAYMDSMMGALTNLTSELVLYSEYELQMRVGVSWVPYDLVAATYTGATMTVHLPNAVSVVLMGKANGLRHVGRKFISGLATYLTDDNGLSAIGITRAADALLAYITPFTGLGGGIITPGVVTSAGVFHPFVGGVVSSILGSMRRRKPGVGI